MDNERRRNAVTVQYVDTFDDPDAVPDYGTLLRLDGRVFVVAGAGQGIGRQIVHALASVGARVVCVDIVEDLARRVADEVDGVPFAGDVTDRAQVARLIAAARDAGPLGGIVDVVGISRFKSLGEISDDDWDSAQALNLRHSFLLAQLGGGALAEAGGGTMVFIASVSGMGAAQVHAAYGAAKAGVISLVRSAAVELGGKGVRVNAVSPGAVRTPRISAAIGEERRPVWDANSPMGRMALPRDIASAVLFLASPLSSYVNGQTLVVDGAVGQRFPYPIETLA
jgi:NAD(P)-dependent dehydrogenase (short-subunit alcohol dehydrogenase family)